MCEIDWRCTVVVRRVWGFLYVKPALSFRVQFPPTPWKRPAGTSQRYDSQVHEKCALGLLILQNLRSLLPEVSKEPHFLKDSPLDVTLHFGFKQPAKSKLEWPTNKSDVDNLAKFVLDTLQSGPLSGRIWHDDGQVVALRVEKSFAEEEFISGTICELEL